MEVGLEAAGLAVVEEEVFGVAGLVVVWELLVVLFVLVVGGLVEPVAGRDDAAVPVVGLKKQDKQEG